MPHRPGAGALEVECLSRVQSASLSRTECFDLALRAMEGGQLVALQPPGKFVVTVSDPNLALAFGGTPGGAANRLLERIGVTNRLLTGWSLVRIRPGEPVFGLYCLPV